MDFKKEIYLLDENDYTIFKINERNEIVQSFGGQNSTLLEFTQLEKISSFGKSAFFTYDYGKQAIIQFDLMGNLLAEIPFKKEVIDFVGNSEGWYVILLPDKKIILGKGKQIFGEKQLLLNELKGEVRLIAMPPKANEFWLIDGQNLYLFEIEAP